MLQSFMGGQALLGVNCEAAFYEFTRGEGDEAPVFEGREGVVGYEDGLHFFEVGVTVEGGVSAKEEVRYYAYCPDVARSHVRYERAVGGWRGERTPACRVLSS